MDWFETWFDTPYYHILYKNHDYSEAENFITKITAYLAMPKSSKVIDLACGRGRHSVYLNKLGYSVLGLDLSPHSIDFDKAFQNENLAFQVHDMRNPIPGEPVDAVFNMFTSFGYFDNETDDKKVFAAVSGILKKGGYFLLDYLNQEFVRETLEPYAEVKREDFLFKISKSVEDHYVVKKINFEDDGKPKSYFERVKLHTPEKIESYAREAGLERVQVWGNYDLGEFDPKTSPRCINLFRKL